MERIAAGGGEEHRVHAQGGRRAEDGPHVGGIHDSLQHRHPAGVPADVLGPGQGGAGHGAEDAAGQGVAGQLGQQLPVAGIDGNVAAPRQQGRALSGQVPPLHQQRQGPEPRVQGRDDDLGTFCDKHPQLRLQPAAQLCLGELGIGRHRRIVEGCEFDNLRHGVPPAIFFPIIADPGRKGNRPRVIFSFARIRPGSRGIHWTGG